MTPTIELVLAVAAAGLILAMPILRSWVLLSGLILARALVDVGAASTGSLAPSALLSTVIAVLALIMGLAHGLAHVPRQVLLTAGAIASILGIWTIIGLVNGGGILVIVQTFKYASIIAIALLAWRVGTDHFARLTSVSTVVVAIPSLLLIAGAAIQLAPMVQDGGRASGTFSHANTAGAYFGLALIVSLQILVLKRQRVQYWFALLAGFALVLTQSLGAIAASAAGVFIVILFAKTIATRAKLTIVVVAGVVGASLLYATNAISRLSEFDKIDIGGSIAAGSTTNSVEWRFLNWNLILARAVESPLFGRGLGMSAEYWPLGSLPHSMYVEAFYEFGIVGCVAIVITVAASSIAIARRLTFLAPGVAGLLAFFALSGFASNILGYTAALYLAAGLFTMVVSGSRQLDGAFGQGGQPLRLNPREETWAISRRRITDHRPPR